MRQEFLRVEIRRRDDRLAAADGVRERAADDLHRVEIRRQVDVGRCEIADEFVEVEIFVDELHVVLQARSRTIVLQRLAIRLAFVAAHDRVRLPEDQVERFGMAFDDVAHRFDRVFQALAAIDQAEGRDHDALADAERGFCRIGIAERHVGNAVMDDLQTIADRCRRRFRAIRGRFPRATRPCSRSRTARASRAASFRRDRAARCAALRRPVCQRRESDRSAIRRVRRRTVRTRAGC